MGISYVNGQCDWISPADEAAADEAALTEAKAAAAAAEQASVEDAAYARYQAAHGEHSGRTRSTNRVMVTATTRMAPNLASRMRPLPHYDEVLAARVAAKQARADRSCYTGVGPVPWADDYVSRR